MPQGSGRFDSTAGDGALVCPDQLTEHPGHVQGAVDLPGEGGRRVQGAVQQSDGARGRAVRYVDSLAIGYTAECAHCGKLIHP